MFRTKKTSKNEFPRRTFWIIWQKLCSISYATYKKLREKKMIINLHWFCALCSCCDFLCCIRDKSNNYSLRKSTSALGSREFGINLHFLRHYSFQGQLLEFPFSRWLSRKCFQLTSNNRSTKFVLKWSSGNDSIPWSGTSVRDSHRSGHVSMFLKFLKFLKLYRGSFRKC